MPDRDASSTNLDVGAYCREVETFLCRRNGGHLVRVVGPAFALVSGWAVEGVPLRVVLHGIERAVSRLEARGPRRRPVRIEFCQADVRDAFDQWRRAVGPHAVGGTGAGGTDTTAREAPSERRQPSLTRHVERVIERLSSIRASTPMAETAGRAVDAALVALDEVLGSARGARGGARLAVTERLQRIDEALVEALVEASMGDTRDALLADARRELRPLRPRLSDEAYREAESRVVRQLLRAHLHLPEIVLS